MAGQFKANDDINGSFWPGPMSKTPTRGATRRKKPEQPEEKLSNCNPTLPTPHTPLSLYPLVRPKNAPSAPVWPTATSAEETFTRGEATRLTGAVKSCIARTAVLSIEMEMGGRAEEEEVSPFSPRAVIQSGTAWVLRRV